MELRNFTISDAQGLLELLSNPRVNCFLSDKITTQQEALSEVEKKSKDDTHIAVILKEDKSLIGMLFYLFEAPDTYSIGYNFNARYKGKGYASESVNAFIQYLFTEKKPEDYMPMLRKIIIAPKSYVKNWVCVKRAAFWNLFHLPLIVMVFLNTKIRFNMRC